MSSAAEKAKVKDGRMNVMVRTKATSLGMRLGIGGAAAAANALCEDDALLPLRPDRVPRLLTLLPEVLEL